MEVSTIEKEEYDLDDTSTRLFEDGHAFSFARVEIKGSYLKFAWNSIGVTPAIKEIQASSLLFIGIDSYVAGYNYKKRIVDFSLQTDTNFKWFDDIPDGIAVIAETEIILINIYDKCSIRGFYCFPDIIMGSKVANGKMTLSFLSDSDKVVPV